MWQKLRVLLSHFMNDTAPRRPRPAIDKTIIVRVADALRTELETAARQSGEDVSDVARRALVEWATARVIARGGPAMSGIATGNGQDPQTKEQRT